MTAYVCAARDPLSQLKRAMASPDLIPKLALHPELRGLLGDEHFMKDLAEIQANPDTLGSYVLVDTLGGRGERCLAVVLKKLVGSCHHPLPFTRAGSSTTPTS